MEKLKLCRKYKISSVPGDADVLENAPKKLKEKLTSILRLKPMRTASGVSPVAVMTSPEDCPHGVCLYCPGGVENDSPQSYTGQEPAALRAGTNLYDPYLQTKNRLEQYKKMGHSTDKIDLIVMGGTFPSREREYRESFVRRCFDAMNGKNSESLTAAHILNETAPHRCIGMTIETRPDHCLEKEVNQILALGGTRVELGVQTTYDHILKAVNRGHRVRETKISTGLVKDAGLKLVYHMMPGLPGTNPGMDLRSFEEIFRNPDYRPDMLKIYPTLVVKGTELHQMWKKGKYEPLTTEMAVDLLAKVKPQLPKYVRIQRIQRDIPAKLIEAGVKKSNLRQLVQKKMETIHKECNCIRCRESGHTKRKPEKIEFQKFEYSASGGRELFLSYEDVKNRVLVAYLRLRFPSPNSENGIKERAIIRELKVSGNVVPIGEHDESLFQHRGYGKKLVHGAEKISVENGRKSLIVTSGVGVRNYYRKLGFKRTGHYMEKNLG